MRRALKHFRAKDLSPVKILYLHSSEFSRQSGSERGGGKVGVGLLSGGLSISAKPQALGQCSETSQLKGNLEHTERMCSLCLLGSMCSPGHHQSEPATTDIQLSLQTDARPSLLSHCEPAKELLLYFVV